MALVNTFGAPAPQVAAPVAKQIAQTKTKDRLSAFLAQSAHESPDQLAGKYGELFDSGGGFGFGEASSLGGDSVAAGAINARMKDILNKNVGFQRANLLGGAVGDYSNRMSQTQALHDSVTRQRHINEQIAAQKKAQKKAKQQGLKTAILGLAGAGAGAAVGGPSGAMIGSGVGQTVGNL